MRFLDKMIPVNERIIERLNDIIDVLMEEWNKMLNSYFMEEKYAAIDKTMSGIRIRL